MVCTTFLDTTERSNVTDKELLDLLDKKDVFKTHYVVKERTVFKYKRYLLIFETEYRETVYDIYYRYDGVDSTSVQQLTLPSNSLKGTLNYFYGVLGGLETNAIQN